MMITVLVKLGFVSLVALSVDAHGYLKSPRARNYIAWQDGVWSGSYPDKYPKESCPHCLNIGGTEGRCGQNYDIPRSTNGSIMPANPQIVAQRGGIITVELLLTAHHKGHFEFNACAVSSTGVAPSQACFDASPLTLVSDEFYGSQPDPDYPTRVYIPPASYARTNSEGLSGKWYRYKLQLPDNVVGDLVLLQWHYLTGNSCIYPGYDSYNFPSEWGNMGYGLGICSTPLPADGRGVPEQFWNCAEMEITDGPVAPVNPPPVAAPITRTPAPVSQAPIYDGPATPTEAPIYKSPPVDAPPQYCGNGNVGNGICEDATLCCSQWGWCGTTVDHCKGNDQPTPSPVPPTLSPINPTPSPANPTSAPVPVQPTTTPIDPTPSPVNPTPSPIPPTPAPVQPTPPPAGGVQCVANNYGLNNWINDRHCKQCETRFVNWWPCMFNGKPACTCS